MTFVRGSAEFAELVAAQDRRLEREGIPMYLVLVSEVGGDVPAPPAECVASGLQVADTLDRFRAAMAPNQRDDDHGVYISVMQAVSYCEFDASRLSGANAAVSDINADVAEDAAASAEPIRPHGPRDSEAAL